MSDIGYVLSLDVCTGRFSYPTKERFSCFTSISVKLLTDSEIVFQSQWQKNVFKAVVIFGIYCSSASIFDVFLNKIRLDSVF